jgi:heme/copper-type cytochrome/quinol oxidase subunit 2
MTQYDAGPGDWSDREWEVEDQKPKPQAKRRRVTLPPWALLAILVGIIIVLCVGLVLIVNAIRGGGNDETPTPVATATTMPTETQAPVAPTEVLTQTLTPTVVLPIGETPTPVPPTEIGPGATVLVQGTLGAGLNLRAEPSTTAQLVVNVKDGVALTVLEGPEEAGGYVWWKLQTADGQEGWGAANWLVLKTE